MITFYKMPLLFLEQLPLPSLQSYAIVSLLLFISSFLYAFNVTTNSDNETLIFTLHEYMTLDSFCFWVSTVHILAMVRNLWCEIWLSHLIFMNSLLICAFLQHSTVNFEHGLLLFVFVWKNYPATCVWKYQAQWTSGKKWNFFCNNKIYFRKQVRNTSHLNYFSLYFDYR